MSGMTIVEFVTQRLDEWEAAAEAFARGRERLTIYGRDVNPEGDAAVAAYEGDGGPADPARVLAQVAAMRAIVDEAREYSPELEHGDNGEWALDVTLRHLATIWRNHESYGPAWAPEGE